MFKSKEQFFASPAIVIAGVSRNKNKFGYKVFEAMLKKGYNVLPVNPLTEVIDGKACFKDISDIQGEFSLLVLTPKNQTEAIVKKAIEKGIKNIWIQQSSETKTSIEIAKKNNVNLIYKECIFMFTNPTGLHKFHRNIKKLFGMIND